ncbi:type IV pilin protein [Dyella sp. KRB-257]|uniref:type IV pilin protein n=1 Tax=Dyella sp. KRB-257 TaxID=3400915 RepID=UPI003C0D2AD5
MSHPHRKFQSKHRGAGFSLIELMIVVAIIAILAAIAFPSYTRYVTRTHRVAAEGCLSELGNYMERFYTTNLRYDQDSSATAPSITGFDCEGAAQTGNDYTYQFKAGQPTRSTFVIEAVPQGAQATRDASCGTLSLDQAGTRTVSGTGALSDCWR